MGKSGFLAGIAVLGLGTGCTSTGHSYEYSPSGYQSEASESRKGATFEETLKNHGYAVFKRSGSSAHPLVLIADIHSLPMRHRTNALLADVLTGDDILYVEGVDTGVRHKDLEDKLFHELGFDEAIAQKCREGAKEDLAPDFEHPFSYFRQHFPCSVRSSEDGPLLGLACAIKNDLNTEDQDSRDGQEQIAKIYPVFHRTMHYRNLSMARTLSQPRNVPGTVYQVIGAQHLLTAEETAKLGYHRPTFYNLTAGELTALLETANIPFIIIGPKDIGKEKERVLQDPEELSLNGDNR